MMETPITKMDDDWGYPYDLGHLLSSTDGFAQWN